MGSDHEAEVRRRLTNIEQKTDSMQDSLTWLVRASAKELLPRLLEEFGKSERRIAVYLAVNGERSVNVLAEHLGMKQENVSIQLAWLKNKKIVRLRGKRYVKEDFDGIVDLSQHLEQRLKDLQKGKGASATKSPRREIRSKGTT
jgi:DNA-binding transcriptional ArsR family regulator